MRKLLKLNFMIEKSNKKNLLTLLIIAVFVWGAFSYLKALDPVSLLEKKTFEYNNVQTALNKFQVVDFIPNTVNYGIYQNLATQKQMVVSQKMALKMNRPDVFLESAIKLAELRETSYDYDEYEKVKDNLPTKAENQFTKILYQVLSKTGTTVYPDNLAYFQFMAFLFTILGGVWFIFVSIYTCSNMIEEFNHTSIIKGYPVSFEKFLLAKSLLATIILCFFMIMIFIAGIPIIFMHGIGDISYPIAVFDGSFEIYPTYKYLIVSLVYMLFIGVFTILLSMILNILLKNMYLTLFVQIILYVLPTLFPILVKWLPFNPFNYMNFTNLFNGVALDYQHPVSLNSNLGLIFIGLSILLMFVVVRRYFTTGTLKRI